MFSHSDYVKHYSVPHIKIIKRMLDCIDAKNSVFENLNIELSLKDSISVESVESAVKKTALKPSLTQT